MQNTTGLSWTNNRAARAARIFKALSNLKNNKAKKQYPDYISTSALTQSTHAIFVEYFRRVNVYFEKTFSISLPVVAFG